MNQITGNSYIILLILYTKNYEPIGLFSYFREGGGIDRYFLLFTKGDKHSVPKTVAPPFTWQYETDICPCSDQNVPEIGEGDA